MDAADRGLSGTAALVAAVGGLLVWAGIEDAPLLDAVRSIARGRAPTGRPPQPAPSRDTLTEHPRDTLTDARATAIVAAARRYIGRPYRWGATGPDAFDCSGLVWRALSDAGVQHRRLTSYGYRLWDGAYDVPRHQGSAGDLVCYSGHIGIAVSKTRMIHAPRRGKPVQESTIYNGQGGPVFRRIRA